MMSMMRTGLKRHVRGADLEGHALAALHSGDERRLGEAVAVDHALDRDRDAAVTGTGVSVLIGRGGVHDACRPARHLTVTVREPVSTQVAAGASAAQTARSGVIRLSVTVTLVSSVLPRLVAVMV